MESQTSCKAPLRASGDAGRASEERGGEGGSASEEIGLQGDRKRRGGLQGDRKSVGGQTYVRMSWRSDRSLDLMFS